MAIVIRDVFKLRRIDYLLFYVHHIAEQRHKPHSASHTPPQFSPHPCFSAKRQFTPTDYNIL